VPEADEHPGGGAGDVGPVRGRARRRDPISQRARGPVLPGPDARRELELGAQAAHRDHQGRRDGSPASADPSRVGGDAQRAQRADGAVGDPDRATPGAVHRRGGARPQARRDPVRDVARRDDLPALPEQGGPTGSWYRPSRS
jgi:hypothetical protein